MAALIVALHHTSQSQLPVTLVGAGLPQVRGRIGKAKSYAERLFDFPEIAALSPTDARWAMQKPAQAEGVTFTDSALDAIVSQTQGYPYFLQEWGKHVWNAADSSPITASVVDDAAKLAIASLDQSFFRVRFDRLTPSERRYLRAMADLGPGPHRSGVIAQNSAGSFHRSRRHVAISLAKAWSGARSTETPASPCQCSMNLYCAQCPRTATTVRFPITQRVRRDAQTWRERNINSSRQAPWFSDYTMRLQRTNIKAGGKR